VLGKRTLLIALSTALLFAGAVAAALASKSGFLHRSDSGPGMRYVVYRPAGLARDHQVPLVAVMTGLNPNDLVTMTGFNAVADRSGFVVAYLSVPDTNNDQAEQTGGAGEPYADLQFVHKALGEIRSAENIDPGRVYLTGFSSGAHLSFRAACILSADLTAVAPVAARLVEPNCTPSTPVSLFLLWGTTDPTTKASDILASIAHWRAVDGCPSAATTTTARAATVQTWSGCRLGTVVSLATIQGQDHGWPSDRFPATEAIWSFFASQRRAGPATTPTATATVLSVRVQKTGARRRLLVRIRADTSVAVRISLFKATSIAAKAAWQIPVGTRVLSWQVPTRVAPGRYRLRIVLQPLPAGKPTVVVLRVSLPK
jgi:polyhydroxybutyrate depolymerase